MNGDNYINLFTNNEKDLLFNKISFIINNTFIKLNIIHKKILIKYLYILIHLFNLYFNEYNILDQLFMNNNQDLFSLFVLLMPYYELNTSNNIESLDELFLNENSKSKSLSSSYYIDHNDFKSNKNYLDKYFIAVIVCIIKTFSKTCHKIFPNWCNIFPYTMETIRDSKLYKNFEYLYTRKIFSDSINNHLYNWINISDPKNFKLDSLEIENHFILGYNTLYGTIYNFLYKDIMLIKWIIYDLNIENSKIIPNIIYLGDKLKINSIINESWDNLNDNKKEELKRSWYNFITNPLTNKISIQSLILFYLRWEKDNDSLYDLELSNKFLKNIEVKYIDKIYEDINDIFEIKFSSSELDKNLEKIYSKINFENIYKFIYESMHKFRYTWYGYCCLDENKIILNENKFFEHYFKINKYIKFGNIFENNTNVNYFYLTPKNIYNFCKALIHKNVNEEYKLLSSMGDWDNVNYNNQMIFINRLNDNDEENLNWFNIKNNLKRTYVEDKKLIHKIQIEININLIRTELFVNIIFQTLVYNGILSFMKYNPKMTNTLIIPDKNLDFHKWSNYIKKTIDIKSYDKSYHPFSNTRLINHKKNVIETIINSMWYTNFGANWIAQIQLYHHYLHQRVMFITGATGAGKSTVAPFLLLYAVKILNYNNNAKVVCTQPRTQPVKDNSVQMSKNIGIIIDVKTKKHFDEGLYQNVSISEGIIEDVNYIQYIHGDGNLSDNLYHPYLRTYTDGYLYNVLKKNYIFKKINNKNIFEEYNLFDIILVDEAHEHNIYMDMILTLSKYAIYINNQVSLGIISATMDTDELVYRKYFQPIDDNYKAPLNQINIPDEINEAQLIEIFIPKKHYIDRRIHLSIPFGGMNFNVKEYTFMNGIKYDFGQNIIGINNFSDIELINKDVILITKHIIKTTNSGDILIFQPGEAEIKKLVIEINKETPSNVLAIPFYSKLENNILEDIVKKIADDRIRRKLRYPKNKYDITQINNIPINDLLPENTYNRFIIIATNIAEASITINSLEFVIDTGNQKLSIYDLDTNSDELKTVAISIPNQKQRKGRVGRVKPGTVFYTYDRQKLSERVICKINIQNINANILELLTSKNDKFIDIHNDPYKINSRAELIDCLFKQYTVRNINDDDSLYHNPNKQNLADKIIYPYSDGKYKLETLEDKIGTFFIIHPNEESFERDEELNIINKPNYLNKITKIIEFYKNNKLINSDNLCTDYGNLVINTIDFSELVSIDHIKIIFDCLSFDININLESDFFKNIILFLIFKNNEIKLKISTNLVGNADYLIYSNIISDDLFKNIKYEDIENDIDSELKNFKEIITKNVNNLVYNKLSRKINSIVYFNDPIKDNTENIIKILIEYYSIKFKIHIIKLNTNYTYKKYFENVFLKMNIKIYEDKLLENQKKLVIKFIDLYNNSKKYIDKKLLKEFEKELENYSNIKTIDYLRKNIDKILNSKSLYENNDYLANINLNHNEKNSDILINLFNNFSEYDKLCFIIIKNLPLNIIIKIPNTEFYINYYIKDINKLYSLEKSFFGNKIITKVPNNIRNNLIFIIKMTEQFNLTNILKLSEYIVKILNKYLNYNNLLITKNIKFDEEYCSKIYSKEKCKEIIKKIDKINKYVKHIN